MIVQKEFLLKIKDFGLNSYEAKLWTALLSRGVSTAGELSDIAGVPRSRSYDVLESLEKKGFIVMKLGKPIKYLAVPPSEVVDRIKKQIREDADRQSKLLESLKGSPVLDELTVLHQQGIELVDPTELTGTIKGRPNLYNHLYSIIKNATKSVSVYTTSSGLVRKADALKPAFAKARERGVRIRIIAQKTKDSSPAMQGFGSLAQLRHSNTPSRFVVVDGKHAVMMMLDDSQVHPNYDFGIWTTSTFFASSLENIFNALWDTLPDKKP